MERHHPRRSKATGSPYNFPTTLTPALSDDDGYLEIPNHTNERAYPSSGGANLSHNRTLSPQNSGSFQGLQVPVQHSREGPRYYEYSRHRTNPAYLTPESFRVNNPNPSFQNDSRNMSLSYEHRTFPDYPQSAMMHDPSQDQEDNSMQHHRYPSPPPPMSDNPYNPHNLDATAALGIEDLPELPQKEDSDPSSPGRSKPIPKPDREVTKGEDGRFICSWVGCTEDVRSFNRKCEWSKHMDKHDRPYKCPADGCEKLPGFTYSGGLLRHQREVHNLHGGPRKQLNCPHPNCKRFSGKGFSRQENLNEHLRRVHTDTGDLVNVGSEEIEEDAEELRTGMKRKRGSQQDDSGDLRQEMARLRNENDELRRQTETLMHQMNSLQQLVGNRLQQATQHIQPHQAPQATMM